MKMVWNRINESKIFKLIISEENKIFFVHVNLFWMKDILETKLNIFNASENKNCINIF